MAEIGVNIKKTVCPQCKDKTKVILDHTAGDLVCTSCGLVLEGQCIDEGQEWRNFSYDGAEYGQRVDPRVRADVTSAQDELIGELDSTAISGCSASAQSLQRAHRIAVAASASTMSKSDRNLKAYASKVRDVASSLCLSENIVRRCVELIQELANLGELNPKTMPPAWHCAVIFLACSEERAARTIKELAAAHAPAAGKKEGEYDKQITKHVNVLRKKLAAKLHDSKRPIEEEELMKRFACRLQISPEVCAPASEICKNAQRYGIAQQKRHTQDALVAASIFIVAWLLNVEQKPDWKDVAIIARVTDSAVKSAYKTISPHIPKLLPETFRSRLPGGLKALPSAEAR